MNNELDRLLLLEKRMDDIEAMLRGHRDSGEGGIVHVLQRMVETVYGPSNTPGGIVVEVQKIPRITEALFGPDNRSGIAEDVGKMKRIMWIGVGMMISIEVLGKVLSWLNAIK